MPTRSRHAAEADEQQETPSGGQKLQFNEPLSWRAGKPIAIAELLRRLSTLSTELRGMEQGMVDKDSLVKVAKELAGHHLLAHKDKGVRAWTACCLVDILGLCAPDAPYTAAQLKDIFTLIITSVFPALSDPSNAYNKQHIYVLQSLAQVKSILLLNDLPSSDSLIVHLFTSFFDILSGTTKSSTGEQLGKNVEYSMTSVLVVLVDEASQLPLEVVDIILAQFLRADPRILTAGGIKTKRNGAVPTPDEKQSTLLLKELPPAYNMAKTICNSCPEKMARYVSQYFNDVIVDASSSVADGAAKGRSHRRGSTARDVSDDDGHAGPTEEDLKDLNKAHRLLRELWRASPGILQNVIPQLEAELSAENLQLRLLATETLGDMVSGIGAAGPPPVPTLDPTAYPPPTLDSHSEPLTPPSILTTPSSPQPFPQAHHVAYHSFVNRKHDKSAVIRSAWTTAVGWILSTAGGGIGLSPHDEQQLVKDLATMLVDADERVRVAAVKAIGLFSFHDIVVKLGSIGGVDKEGSVLCNLAGRARDRKHAVRVEGMMTLGRLWGVAVGEIADGNEVVVTALGSIPSKLFDTFYVNDRDINLLSDQVLFEVLLPLDYPRSKSKSLKNGISNSQASKNNSQTNGGIEKESLDCDKIRTERLLHLVKGLDPKAKKAFFAMQGRQVQLSNIMQVFLKKCEEYNGGVMDNGEAEIKAHLTRLINFFADIFPDSSKVSSDLWKFAKAHDRRNYQLMRFCMDPSSDYRTVVKAIKELRKRIETQPGSANGTLDTLMALLYRTSLLIYNKSHIPAIVELSRTDEKGLGQTSHEVLKEISTRHPEVFKAHVKELCRILQDQAPTSTTPGDPGAIDTLKACAAFSTRYPKEMPQDRNFLQSLMKYALYGSPPVAAKYAVTIILSLPEKREMYAKDLLQKSVKGFEYGSNHFLTRLAALSQLVLLAPKEADEENDAILDIALKEIFLKVRTSTEKNGEEDQQRQQRTWVEDNEVDDECNAKLWALKVLVNRVRSHPDSETLKEAAGRVYQLLNTLIAKEGELSKNQDTPSPSRSRLRLAASRLFLKLCTSKPHDELLKPKDFNRLAYMAQDSVLQVRLGFTGRLKKYLGQGRLSHRFYAIVFLQAFEPKQDLREGTVTWIRARARFFAQKKSTAMESLFARLLSLLAHHPDFSTSVEDLTDFATYILFYLRPVATEENLSLIYYVAQRVKQTKDAIDPEKSENLYYLSDLSQEIIRRYEDVMGWSMQVWPGKMGLPSSLFGPIGDPDLAHEIATKSHLPEGVLEKLDRIVKARPRQKRKSEGQEIESTNPAKKKPKPSPATNSSTTKSKTKPKASSSSSSRSKATTTTVTTKSTAAKTKKTPVKGRARKGKGEGEEDKEDDTSINIPSSEIRRSTRTASSGNKVKSYAESSDDNNDDDDDDDMDDDDRDGVEDEDMADDDDSDGDGDAVEEQEEQEEERMVVRGGRHQKQNGKMQQERQQEKKEKVVDEGKINNDDDTSSNVDDLSTPPASDLEPELESESEP